MIVIECKLIYFLLNMYGRQELMALTFNGNNKKPTFEELVKYSEYQNHYHVRTAKISSHSHSSTHIYGMGMMEFKEQQRRDMFKRHSEDLLRNVASSSEYTLQE